MKRISPLQVLALAAAALLVSSAAVVGARRAPDTLPSSLSGADFWSLTGRLSEEDGTFVSRSGSPDNLLSNENSISSVAAELAARVKPGGVYLGVGPEQNFTYMAATRPRFAFIVDIRRGNLDLHLISNVEQYLQTNGVWGTFCANAASLPIDAASIFIRPGGRGGSWFGSMSSETSGCRR